MAHKHLALVHPKTGAAKFEGVVIPYKSPIDKILAALLAIYKSDSEIRVIEFWKDNQCPPEQFAAWRDAKIYPIDIGDRKYHEVGVGSASEFVVKEFGMELTDGFVKLVGLINKNNKTGMLKGYKFSMAYMLRELYELDESEVFHATVVSKTIDVLESFAAVENGTMMQPIDGLDEALPDLVKKFEGCNYSPLTLGRYLRDRWLLGDEPSVIREKVEFWTKNFDEVRDKLAHAAAAAKKFAPIVHDVAGTRAVVVKSDDRFFAKAIIKSGLYGIRVIVSGSGHTVISTNGYDLAKMAGALEKLEPGKWYHQSRMGALINGGPQYVGVEPTSIGSAQLIGLMKMHVQPKGDAVMERPQRPQPEAWTAVRAEGRGASPGHRGSSKAGLILSVDKQHTPGIRAGGAFFIHTSYLLFY